MLMFLTFADFRWLLLAFAGFCLVPPARAMVTDRAVVERYEWAELRLQRRSASAAFGAVHT